MPKFRTRYQQTTITLIGGKLMVRLVFRDSLSRDKIAIALFSGGLSVYNAILGYLRGVSYF